MLRGNERARELLCSFLDPDQLELYEERRYFYVTDENYVYALYDGQRVVQMQNRKPRIAYNVWGAAEYPDAPLPLEDSLLIQMLALQTMGSSFTHLGCTLSVYAYDSPRSRHNNIGWPEALWGDKRCPKMGGWLRTVINK